jgi:cytochrome c553
MIYPTDLRARSSRGLLPLAVGLIAMLSSARLWATPTCDPDFGGDTAKGREIAARLCSTCHQLDGKAIARLFPNLAGQGPEYLVKQLKAFKAPTTGKPLRPSAVMTPLVAGLSETDFVNLAAYYSSLPPVSGVPREPSRVELGREIYTKGDPAAGLPACVTCHRPGGAGIRPDFPRLAGQNPEYVAQQLSTWMSVRGKPGKLMTLIVPHLSAQAREAVADYVAQLHSDSALR